MAESFKVVSDGRKGLMEAVAVFPELRGRVNYGTKVVTIYDAKAGEWAVVEKGQYIVKIADRFEVSDSEPEKANPVESPKKDAQRHVSAPEKADEPKGEVKPQKKAETKPEPSTEA